MGVADSRLDQQRATAATAASAAGGGKQKELSLWFADANGQVTDPSFLAHELPITALAKPAWEAWWSPSSTSRDNCSRHGISELAGHLRTATHRIRSAEWQWSKVTGPFAAAAASAKRIGWKYTGGLSFVTDIGQPVDLSQDSPQFVKLKARQSVRRWREDNISKLLPGVLPGRTGLITRGINCAVKQPKAKDPLAPYWAPGCSSALRSAVSNGQWPQVRLK